MKNLFIFFVFLIFLFFLFNKNFNKTIALVGNSIITERDINDKIKIERAYGNLNFDRTLALISLINDLLEYEIARQFKILPTKEEILAFKKHTETTSKAPAILMKVKNVFADDEKRYERIYLFPKIINNKLRYFYSQNYEFHRKEREKIETAYSLILKGESFPSVAQKLKLERLETELEEKVEVPELLAGIIFPENKLIEIIKKTPVNSVIKGIVDDDFSFMIIKNLGKRNGSWKVEMIVVNKTSFDDWFKKEASKLKIEIKDNSLKEKIKKQYPNIWWVKEI